MKELLNNETFVWCTMALVAFLVTQGLKWAFVKPFTKNLSQKAKTIINSVILVIAFGSAVLCEFLYSHFWLQSAIDLNRALQGWGGASAVYGVFEWFVKAIKGNNVNIENPYQTEDGKAILNTVGEIVKDGKIDGNDKTVVKEFIEKVK